MGHIPEHGPERTDAELIRAGRTEPASFESFVTRHANVLDRWLYAQTGDISTAHELMAETFAEAWRGARRFRGEGENAGAAWLYGIARNLLRQYYRRGRLENAARLRLGIQMPISTGDDAESIARRIDAAELAPAVRKAFAELTPEQREAIAYRVVDELSYEEVAARLQCNTTTARSRVFRGLETLRATVVKGAQT
ncbi:MAG TPA: RNA polymerase sigma factor [Solirubrobacteraceae bacterium]|jgi:RNA polymerase sigma-70 factor (ECF subfamily)|nr:RNA polymerase sigma factor [Solirubrobacteraceae bacterium]